MLTPDAGLQARVETGGRSLGEPNRRPGRISEFESGSYSSPHGEDRTTERKVQLGFTVALVLLGAVAAVSYASLRQEAIYAAEVRRAEELINRLHGMLFSVVAAESAQRGYIITEGQVYLAAYDAEAGRLPRLIAELKHQTIGQPVLAGHIAEIGQLVEKRLERARTTIEIRQRAGLAAAQDRVAEGIGKAMIEAIRVHADAAEEAAARRLAENAAKVSRSADIAKAVEIGGGLLALTVVVTAMWMVRRDFAGARRAIAVVRRAQSELEDRVRERTAELARANATLSENDERWRLFMEHAPSALAMFDREQRYLMASRRWREDHRLGEVSRAGRLHEELPAELGERLQAAHLRALAGEIVRVESDSLRRADGSFQWLRWEVRPWLNAGREVGGSVIFSEDITASHDALAANARLAAIVESAQDAIIGVSRNGEVTTWNRGAATMFGYAATEILGKSIAILMPPGRLPELMELLADVRQGRAVTQIATQRQRKDGTLVDVEISAAPVYDTSGELVGASNNVRDITDRKRADSAAREGDQRLRAIVENLSDGLLVTDMMGCILHYNRAARRMLGVTTEMAGAPAATLSERLEVRTLQGEPLPTESRPMARLLRGEPLHNFEVQVRTGGGGVFRILSFRGHVLSHLNSGALAYLAISDVTEQRAAEAALRRSEMKFAQAFANNPAAIVVTRLEDGVVLELNDTWVELTGYARDEVVGHSARALWTDKAASAKFVAEIREKGRVRGWEQEFRKKSGEPFISEFWAERLSLGEDEVILSTMVDITARKRAEEHLREQEALLQEMGRIAQVGGWTLDVATGAGRWTEEVARIHDLPVTAQPSKELGLRHYPEEARVIIEAAVDRAISDGQPYDLELPFVSATGRHKWVRTIGHPMYEKGRLVRLSGSLQEITERKRAERRQATQAAVSRVLAETATLAEAAPKVIEAICASEDWQFGAIWGVERELGKLRSLAVWLEPGRELAQLEAATRALQLGLGEGLPGLVWQTPAVMFIPEVSADTRYLRSAEAGRAGLHSALAFPVMLGTEVVGILDFVAEERHEPDDRLAEMFEVIGRQLGLFVQHRLAEAQVRRLNEELEQRVQSRTAELESANHELEAFSYSVSHDLRAPLRAIDGFSRIVIEDYGAQLPAEAQHCLGNVAKGAQQMGTLIDDLLTFSRLSRLPISRTAIDTGQLVDAVLGQLEPMLAGRKVDIRRGDLPESRGDQALLRQVWMNLLSNALKYTRRCEAARIEIGACVQEGAEVFFVRDNGAGFDMRYADKLFGVFQRLHRAEDYEGTGVGLAIVQRIIHRHGGRVWAEAAINCGATFYFTLG